MIGRDFASTLGKRRRTTIGVSLKMYLDRSATLAWCQSVAEVAASHPAIVQGAVELFVLPGSVLIGEALRAFEGTRVAVGGQDLFWNDRGPYTGGISGADLKDMGCHYVAIGHAERRQHFGETDETIRFKLEAAYRNDLIPVLCIGEEVRTSTPDAVLACVDQAERFLAGSMRTALPDLVIAYEPQWAIGAPVAASAVHVQQVANSISGWIDENLDCPSARLIYGGAAGPGLLRELGSAVDGLFLGRSAHDVGALAEVLDEAMALRLKESTP